MIGLLCFILARREVFAVLGRVNADAVMARADQALTDPERSRQGRPRAGAASFPR